MAAIVAAAGANEARRPTGMKQVVPALRIGAEPDLEARQVARQILKQHAASPPSTAISLPDRHQAASLSVADS